MHQRRRHPARAQVVLEQPGMDGQITRRTLDRHGVKPGGGFDVPRFVSQSRQHAESASIQWIGLQCFQRKAAGAGIIIPRFG